MVGEAVADITEFALLHVLLDGVQGFLLGDLERQISGRIVNGIEGNPFNKAMKGGRSLPPSWHWSTGEFRRSC